MARKEDISLEKQLADARDEYNRRVKNGLSYQVKQLAEVERLEKKIADNWIKKLENAILENVFFGMCPFITYIYEI